MSGWRLAGRHPEGRTRNDEESRALDSAATADGITVDLGLHSNLISDDAQPGSAKRRPSHRCPTSVDLARASKQGMRKNLALDCLSA